MSLKFTRQMSLKKTDAKDYRSIVLVFAIEYPFPQLVLAKTKLIEINAADRKFEFMPSGSIFFQFGSPEESDCIASAVEEMGNRIRRAAPESRMLKKLLVVGFSFKNEEMIMATFRHNQTFK